MASFLFCCLKGRRKKVHPKDGLRVGRLLLHFWSSDFSRGICCDNNFIIELACIYVSKLHLFSYLSGSPVKDFTSLSNVNSFSDESEDSLGADLELEATDVPPGDTSANLPLPPGRVRPLGASKSASGRKQFGRSANVNRYTINQDNSLTEELVSEEKVPEEKVSEEKVSEEKPSKEKVLEEKASEAKEVPTGDNCSKLPLPPGRVPSLAASNSVPKSPAAPKPAPPEAGSAPTTEPASRDPKPAAASPPPPPPTNNLAPRAPPPPKIGPAPPNPPKAGNVPKAPHGKGPFSANKGNKETSESGGQKAKLKPFFWDKVLANPERSMVWNELKAGSFQ